MDEPTTHRVASRPWWREQIARSGDVDVIEAFATAEASGSGQDVATVIDVFRGAAPRARLRHIRYSTTPDHPHAGRYLRARRQLVGLRQEDLARVTGLSRSAVSRIETGARRLRFDEAIRLAHALGMDAGDLRPQRGRHPISPSPGG